MRKTLILSTLVSLAALSPAAAAQQTDPGGVPTETQRRLAQGDPEIPWDLVGLFGLLGLLGLRPPHPDDSYHPAPLD